MSSLVLLLLVWMALTADGEIWQTDYSFGTQSQCGAADSASSIVQRLQESCSGEKRCVNGTLGVVSTKCSETALSLPSSFFRVQYQKSCDSDFELVDAWPPERCLSFAATRTSTYVGCANDEVFVLKYASLDCTGVVTFVESVPRTCHASPLITSQAYAQTCDSQVPAVNRSFLVSRYPGVLEVSSSCKSPQVCEYGPSVGAPEGWIGISTFGSPNTPWINGMHAVEKEGECVQKDLEWWKMLRVGLGVEMRRYSDAQCLLPKEGASPIFAPCGSRTNVLDGKLQGMYYIGFAPGCGEGFKVSIVVMGIVLFVVLLILLLIYWFWMRRKQVHPPNQAEEIVNLIRADEDFAGEQDGDIPMPL